MDTHAIEQADQQIVHDLEGLQKANAAQSLELRASRRRPSTTKPALAPIKTGLEKGTTTDGTQEIKLTRKRAARACDQCRRRKSRCDGQMNCSACKVVGLHCSYGHTIKQSRGPSYVAHLEKKIEDLEERLKTTACASETVAGIAKSASQSPKYDGLTTAQCSPTTSDWTGLPFTASSLIPDQFGFIGNSQGLEGTDCTPKYLSTITSEPRGKPFGIDILRQLWNYCNISQGSEASLKLVQALDAPFSADALPGNAAPLLPSKAELVRCVGVAFTELWPFVDKAHVQVVIYRLYNTNTFGQEENDKDDLALLYALLALGQRFDTAKNVNADECRIQGASYFCAARNIVPLQSCDRSLAALQTVVCLALYLKAGSALTRAHAYVAAAASAGLRMGLHEAVPCFPEDEQAIKRRVWSTIRCLDVMTSSLLGIPHIVSIAPCEEEPFPSQYSGYEEDLVASSAHVRLTRILCRALDKTYCSSSARKPSSMSTFAVTEDSLREASNELEAWTHSCPLLGTPIENMSRSQLLVVFSQAYAELTLYSPFVHHLANPPGNTSEYSYAFKAFQAAKQAIRVAEVLHKHLWLHEAYFHVLDVLAIASMVLLAVQKTSTAGHLLAEALQSSKRAMELLLLLSLHNPAAREIWTLLKSADLHAEQAAQQGPTNIKRPATLFSQDSGVDVVSPVGSCFNPSPILLDSEALSMPLGVDPVIG